MSKIWKGLNRFDFDKYEPNLEEAEIERDEEFELEEVGER